MKMEELPKDWNKMTDEEKIEWIEAEYEREE